MLNVTIQTSPLRHPKGACFLLFLAGMATVLGFAPLHIWFLYPLGEALLFSVWMRSCTARQSAACGLCFGLGAFSGVSWLVLPLYHFGVLAASAGVLLTILLILCLALTMALVGFVYALTDRSLWWLPILWTVLEVIRSLFFPWLLSGYIHAGAAWSGFVLAPLLGVLGMGWLQAFVITVILGVCYRRFRLFLLIVWVVIIAFVLFCLPKTWVSTRIRLPLDAIQTHIPSFLKWSAHRQHVMLSQYDRLLAETRPDALVIFPETALSWAIHPSDLSALSRFFPAKRDMIIGLPYVDEGGHLYNAAVLVNQEGQTALYFKQHLVPFGEYFPGWLHGLQRILPVPMSSFTPGGAYQPAMIWHSYAVAVLLCYEDVFPAEFRHRAMLSGFFVNMTNDDWYQPSWMQAQHVQMAQMSARMLGRSILRVSNGILSALIDAEGHIDRLLATDGAGVLSVEAQVSIGMTPFVLLGPWLYWVFVILGAASQWLMRIRPASSNTTWRFSWRD